MVLEQSCLFVFVFGLDRKGGKSSVLKNDFCLSSMFFVLVIFFLEKTDFSFDRQC